MSKTHLALLIAVIPALIFVGFIAQDVVVFPFKQTKDTVYINHVPIHVDIADTAGKQRQGLSGREGLGENEGMLFIFSEADQHGIWMKDMRFPIDIIWIAPLSDTSSSGGGERHVIVDIKKDARPESYPEIFFPKYPATHVLEVNADFTDLYNISPGDRVQLP